MSEITVIVDGVISIRMNIPAEPPTQIPTPPDSPPPEFKYQQWQEIAVNEITVDHGLGFKPAAISLVSPDGSTRYQSFGTYYVDDNRVVITTGIPFRGWILIS